MNDKMRNKSLNKFGKKQTCCKQCGMFFEKSPKGTAIPNQCPICIHRRPKVLEHSVVYQKSKPVTYDEAKLIYLNKQVLKNKKEIVELKQKIMVDNL